MTERNANGTQTLLLTGRDAAKALAISQKRCRR
jgi:hypothetical protein